MWDLKLAFRHLVRHPGFALVAVLTFALGIGANTAMFSVVNALILQRAPYPEPQRLVRIYRTAPQARRWPHSLPDLRDVRAAARSFDALTFYCWWTFALTPPGQPAERIPGVIASAELFATLGVSPALGRGFTAVEQQPGRDAVAVISHRFWQGRLAGDPQVVGRRLRIDGQAVTVIGVMPPAAAYPVFWGRVDLWRPLPLAPDWREDRGTRWLNAIGRLRPGGSLPEAQAELDVVAAGLAARFPATDTGGGLLLAPLHETALDGVGRNLAWLAVALAGFVLLIACANIANLQLARGAARARDLAVRAALGAPRGRLARLLLGESALLCLAGGALGLVAASAVADALGRSMLFRQGDGAGVSLPPTVVGFALLVAFAAALGSGAAPAWLASRTDAQAALRSRGGPADRSRLAQGLIVVQVALSLLLLAGSAFFVRGLQRLAATDPGWRPEGLLAGTITLPAHRYATDEQRRVFQDRLLERLAALPGARRAALVSSLPIRESAATPIDVEGRGPAPQAPIATRTHVSPGALEALQVGLVEGRLFPAGLRAGQPPLAVVNETMARTLWPGTSAVGKRIRSTGEGPWRQVIGVVRDVTLPGHLAAVETRLQWYQPMADDPWGYFTLLVRAAAPAALAGPVREVVAGLDADLPVSDLRTVGEAIEDARQNARAIERLLAGFALLGLLLAAVGLYGVTAAVVAQRTRELGIRMALGARPHHTLSLVLARGAGLTAAGTALGLAGAWVLLRVLAALVPGLPGQDPLGLSVAVGALLVVALVASLLPARRATRIDPMVAIRAE